MDDIQKHRTLFIFEGIAFIILGGLAIILPGIMTLGIELLVGWLLVLGGLFQEYRAIKAYQQAGFYPSLLGGLLSLIVGVLFLAYPLTGVLTLTILLLIYFLLDGIAKIVLGIELRSTPKWGWLVVSGILSLILAAIIWSGWPQTAMWVIGLLVGINMIFFGFSLIYLASMPDKSNPQ